MTGARRIQTLDVLWTGDREVAVEKPAGLSSERPDGAAATAGTAAPNDSAITRARAQFGWPDAQLPHRLDRPTSGILVVAADRARAADHAREMREGRWRKWYVARIAAADAGDHLLGAHRRYLRREGRLARCVRSGGDPSALEVLAIEPAPDRSTDAHALIRLETGRFHQIRAMLADLGAPLLGDVDYGGARTRASLELISCGLRIGREDGPVRILSRAAENAGREDRAPDAMGGIAPALVARLRACINDER
ncbi:MAG: pseudouridine synthase [Planctomycetaceae bacterium]|nr:pseudouridine synthase [Planctomycetaceae bacterium]